MTTAPATLRSRIDDRSAVVGIIGLGYVGLPLALTFAEKGFRVLGFDIDAEKVSKLAAGTSYLPHLDGGRVTAEVAAGRLSATADLARLAEPDALLICVPTPLTPQREPDLSYVEATTRAIAATLRPGQLVVLESTTYPGTTDELLRSILDDAGLTLGHDYFLAFSPEREDPGNPSYGTSTIPKVVGGVDSLSGDLAEALYGAVVSATIRVSSARTAEATKLMENIFRAVNIALVNELKVVYDRMGIDVWEVLDAAETKPFGFMRFDPGPGWGGHCIGDREWLRVRGLGLDGVYRAEELYRRIRHRCPAALTCSGMYLETKGLEALALDPSSGEVSWFPVETLYRGRFDGPGFEVVTEGRRQVTVTSRHPMMVIRHEQLEIVPAHALAPGDELPIVSDLGATTQAPEIDLLQVVPADERRRVWVRPIVGDWGDSSAQLESHFGWTIRDSIRSNALRLDRYLEAEEMLGLGRQEIKLLTGQGRARREWPTTLRLSPDFARFLGYYLAEGCITHERNAARVRLTFNRDETELVADVREILERHGFPTSVFNDRTWHSTTIKASSLLLAWLLDDFWHCGCSSTEMRIPEVVFSASPDHKRAILEGLLRGDGDISARSGRRTYRKNGKQYTHRDTTATVGFFSSSPVLLEQVVHLLQDLGFQPSFKAPLKRERTSLDKGPQRQVRLAGARTVDHLVPYFTGRKRRLLETIQSRRTRRVASRSDKAALAPGLRSTKVRTLRPAALGGWVYSLEVEGARTFTTSSGIAVHNCIPLDPFFLSWKAREHGYTPRFIELAGMVNVEMPGHVIAKLQGALNEQGKPVKGSRILLLGLAYKRDIADPRESPAFELIDRLLHLGAEVIYHDPHIPRAPSMRTWPELPPLCSQPLTAETLRAQDAVLLVTDHRGVDYHLVAREAPLIIDTRGVYGNGTPKVVKA